MLNNSHYLPCYYLIQATIISPGLLPKRFPVSVNIIGPPQCCPRAVRMTLLKCKPDNITHPGNTSDGSWVLSEQKIMSLQWPTRPYTISAPFLSDLDFAILSTLSLPGHTGLLAVSTLGLLHWMLHLPGMLASYIFMSPSSLKIFSHLRKAYFETQNFSV